LQNYKEQFFVLCSEIEKQIIGIMQFHEYLFKITQVSRSLCRLRANTGKTH